jgi:hypothetical protein
MNLHFEDWSWPMLLDQIEAKDLVHGGNIIKVYASEEDPRDIFGNPDLTVVEVDGGPLVSTEKYVYPDRDTYTGEDLEAEIDTYDLTELGSNTVRALFRFSHEQGFNNIAMAARRGDDWLIDHPFGAIDGIPLAHLNELRVHSMHLDIFHPDSLPVLREIVDFDDPSKVMESLDGTRLRMKIYGPSTAED